MDSKEIKEALKGAREAIRNKEYKTALKFCKVVLKADKDNYNALVFIGVAAKELDQPDQAVMAFERAISLAPEQILAWQGLLSFYEKSDNPEHKKDLLRVLEKLIQLYNGDLEKQFGIYEKYTELLLTNGDIQKCIEVLRTQLEVANKNEEKEIQVHKAILRAFTKQTTLSSCILQIVEESLEKCMVLDGDDEEKKNWFRHYLSLLRKDGLLDKASKESWKMYNIFPDCYETLETMCEIQLENIFESNENNIEEIQLNANKLLEENPKSNVAKMLILIYAFQHQQWQKMIDCLNTGVNVRNINECKLVIKCYEILHQYPDIIRLAEKGLEFCEALNDSSKMEASFHLSLLSARYSLLGRETVSEDIKTLETIMQTMDCSTEFIILLLLNYLKVNNIDASKELLRRHGKLFQSSELKGYEGLISKAEGKLDVAMNQLSEALIAFPDNITFMLELALVYRSLNDLKNSLLQLKTGVKQDCYNPKLYFEIGNHYKLLKNLKNAQRCYIQAFSICSITEDIGMALSDTYHELNEKEENLKLLTEITQKNGPMKWAWVRLGLHYLKYNDPSAAIKAFLTALRIDPADCYCWEALADAYMTRGSYNAAYKSYSKVLELNPEFVYCSFQMANIKQLLQDYSEAAVGYKAVLDKHPDYVPALKGCSEVFLHQCKEYLKQYLHGLARDCCLKAIQMLERAVSIRTDLVCLWKLLGDAYTLTFLLPSHLTPLHVSSILNPSDTDDCLSKEDLLRLGARCYGKAHSLLPECSGLWHDIGINYYYQSQCSLQTDDTAEKSITAFKKAIRLEPKNLLHWNALGVVSVATKNYALAQHCFIKAINNDRTDCISWTNLGVLYLLHEKIEIANQAFSVAQSIEPLYLNSWIGQATIAEKVESSDSIDLFRHAVDVGNHDEGEIGYSHWVIKTILKSENKETEFYKFWVENMAAITTACDCMTKFTDRNDSTYQALNMYGLLLEKENLHHLALKAFEKALTTHQNSNQCEFEKDQIYTNYARTLCHQGYYNESCTYYGEIKEPDLSSQCGLALAQYKAKRYKDSYESYDAALHWFAKKEEEKSNILVAMALVAYKQGDIENAKTLLFQSSQMESASVHGILALCALGIIHHKSEPNLVFAALRELLPYRHDSKYCIQISFLIMAFSLMQDKTTLAKHQLCKSIHEQPANGDLWRLLSHHLLSHKGLKEAAISALAAQKLNTSFSNLDMNFLKMDINGECLVCFSFLSFGNLIGSLRSSQKAIHLNPGEPANWCGLIAATMAMNYIENKFTSSWIQNILGITEELTNLKSSSLPILRWIKWNRILIALYEKDWKLAQNFIRKISQITSKDSNNDLENTNHLLSYLIDDMERNDNSKTLIDQIKQHVLNNPADNFGWQVLIKKYWMTNQYTEAEKMISQWIETQQMQQMQIQAIPYVYLAKSVLQFSKDKQKKTSLEKSLCKLEKINLMKGNVYFIRSLIGFSENNLGDIKDNLEKILQCIPDDKMSWIKRIAHENLLVL